MTHIHQQSYLSKLGFADPDRKNDMHDIAVRYLTQKEKISKIADLVSARWGEKIKFIRYPEVGVKVSSREVCTRADMSYYLSNEALDKLDEIHGDKTHHLYRTKWRDECKQIIIDREIIYSASALYKAYSASKPINKVVGYGLNARYEVVGYYDIAFEFQFETHEEVSRTAILKNIEKEKTYDVTSAFKNGSSSSQRVMGRNVSCQVEVKIGRVSVSDILQQIATYRSFDYDRYPIVATAWQLTPSEKRELENRDIAHIFLDPKLLIAFRDSEKSETLESF